MMDERIMAWSGTVGTDSADGLILFCPKCLTIKTKFQYNQLERRSTFKHCDAIMLLLETREQHKRRTGTYRKYINGKYVNQGEPHAVLS